MENHIRIITTQEGLKIIMNTLKKFNNQDITDELINKHTCKNYGKIVFIKWDNSKYLKTITSLIIVLTGNNYPYKICFIENDRVKFFSNEVSKNEKTKIPMPVMMCRFNDMETVRQLEENDKGRKHEWDIDQILEL